MDGSRPVTNMLSMRAHLPEHCTDIAEVMGTNPVKVSFFPGAIFTAAQVMFINAKIAS